MPTLRPLNDRVLVKLLPSEEITPGGVIIPEIAREKPQRGLVLAVGPGHRDEHHQRVPIDVKEGDIVLCSRYGGAETKLGNEEYVVLRETDILGVIESEDR